MLPEIFFGLIQCRPIVSGCVIVFKHYHHSAFWHISFFFVFWLDFYYILTCQSIKVLVLVLVLPVGRMAQKIIGFVYLVIAPTRDQKTVSKRTKHIILETQKWFFSGVRGCAPFLDPCPAPHHLGASPPFWNPKYATDSMHRLSQRRTPSVSSLVRLGRRRWSITATTVKARHILECLNHCLHPLLPR